MRFLSVVCAPVALAVVLIVSSSNPSSGQDLSSEQIELAKNGVRILNNYCKKCHGDGQAWPGLDVYDRQGLLSPTNGEEPYIVAGDPSASRIWKQVESNSMPPSSQSQPSDADKAILMKWIEDGAHFPPPERKKRQFFGDRSTVKLITQDLNEVDEEAIEHTRYFTLAHLWNDTEGSQATTDEDLRYTRAAVSKLINSLSYQPRIAVPRVVDPEYGTLLAIDLRDYGWTTDDWDEILNSYPYGLRIGGQDEKRIIRNTGGCATPVIRADWFVNMCSRPPLYHKLLDIPHNAKVLEKKLGVDIPENFRNNRMMRAAFSGLKSGVSEQNRMVERHDQAGAGRFYWKSYDMLPGPEREHDFVRSPLGPRGMSSDYRGSEFAHDGGEIIFSLPNGLQAYMLIDGNDARIDVGPREVVRDPNQHGGSFDIVNGVSCMGCHKAGMIKWEDDFVRPAFAKLQGRTADKVLELYPENKDFFELVDGDRDHFLGAMNKACGDFLLGRNVKDMSSKYNQFFQDVLLATKTKYDSAKLTDFLNEEMKREVYTSLQPRECVLQLAAKGKEQLDLDVSIDAVLGMYELNPLTKRQSVGDFKDPITWVTRRYVRDINLNDACREMGLPADPKVAEANDIKSIYDLKAIFGTRQFRDMGVSALSGKDGSIPRKSWEEFYGKAARAMDIGIPIEYSTHYGN